MTTVLGYIDEAILFGLLSFGAQLLLQFLRAGCGIRVRLIPSPAQNQVFNYEICNIGDTPAEDVRVTFSRPAEDEPEMWNTQGRQDLHFEVLSPGEAYSSMFCLPARWGSRDPVTVTVRYRNSRLFRRLADIDDEQRLWRVLSRLVSLRFRVPRRKSFVLDPPRLFAMRANVGYPGKTELGEIAEGRKGMRKLQEDEARPSLFGLASSPGDRTLL